MMYKELCQDCGRVFEPKSGKTMICPECHKKRLSIYARERNLNKLGTDAYSAQQARIKAERNAKR